MPPLIDDDHTRVCDESRPRELPTVTYPHECSHCAAVVADCPAEAITLSIPLSMRL